MPEFDCSIVVIELKFLNADVQKGVQRQGNKADAPSRRTPSTNHYLSSCPSVQMNTRVCSRSIPKLLAPQSRLFSATSCPASHISRAYSRAVSTAFRYFRLKNAAGLFCFLMYSAFSQHKKALIKCIISLMLTTATSLRRLSSIFIW